MMIGYFIIPDLPSMNFHSITVLDSPPPMSSFRTSNMIKEPQPSGGPTDLMEEPQFSRGATNFMPAVHPDQEQYLVHPGQEQYLDSNYSSKYYLDPNINQSYSHQNYTATAQPFGMFSVHSQRIKRKICLMFPKAGKTQQVLLLLMEMRIRIPILTTTMKMMKIKKGSLMTDC
jgi:hypothetical protein